MRVGILYSRVRAEEKLIVQAFRARGIEPEMLDVRRIGFDLQQEGNWQEFDVMLERCVSHSRAITAVQILESFGVPCINYVCQRPMAHTAGQEESVGETAVSFWNAIAKYTARFNAGCDRLFDQLMPSIREFHTSSDGLINRAEMKMGLRLPPAFDKAGFIQKNIETAETSEVSIKTYGYEPAYQSDNRHSLARQFRVALRQAGARPRFKLKTGTSDMNVVGPVWNCPIVAYGPGDSRLDHTPNEHIVIEEYRRAINVLQTVLANGRH